MVSSERAGNRESIFIIRVRGVRARAGIIIMRTPRGSVSCHQNTSFTVKQYNKKKYFKLHTCLTSAVSRLELKGRAEIEKELREQLEDLSQKKESSEL